jgi:hypothetical protein
MFRGLTLAGKGYRRDPYERDGRVSRREPRSKMRMLGLEEYDE